MSGDKRTDSLEIAIHIIIVLLGVLVLKFAYDLQDKFWQPLWVNVGSSLVVVTILFAIFEAFRRRHDDRDIKKPIPREEQISYSDKESKAQELIITLRASQSPLVTTDSSKIAEPIKHEERK